MKLNNIFKSLLALSMVAMVATSCQDEIVNIDELHGQNDAHKESTAEPVILGVYDYKAFMASDTPSPCIEAQMGQDLVIKGENLQGLTSISLKGVEIDPADYYAEWDQVVLRIPYKLPNKEAANVLMCENKFGSTESSLELLIPDIVLSNVTNAFCMPGERTYINGKFLSLCEFENGVSKIYIENEAAGYKKEVEITLVTDDSATITIPSDAPDNSLFVFEINGETLTQKFHYRPTDCLLFDGTNPENTCNWTDFAYTDGTADGDIENLIPYAVGENTELVKYIRVFGDIPKYKFLYSINYDIDFELEEGKTTADYAVEFEINTAKGHPIPVGNTYKFMVNNKPVNMWENYSKVEIDTNGEWVTQRISFVEVAKLLKGGVEIERFDIKNMLALSDADHAFANFRIVPIIK